MVYADKEKALEWLTRREPHAHKYTNQELNIAAKVVKEFENPSLPKPQKVRRHRVSATGRIWQMRWKEKEKFVSASSSDIETEHEGMRNGTAAPHNNKTLSDV